MTEYRILVVDDNLMALKLLTQHLRMMGLTRIETATSAAAASDRLEQANKDGEPFHLMLLDWHMPGLDGSQFLTKCRLVPLLNSMQIIMVTAENDPESVRLAMNHGATSYIVKPVSYTELKKLVSQVLQPRVHPVA